MRAVVIAGVGRHADSLGNRGTYSTPGMQWMSVGSGVEHAEAGGTPAGQNTTGFQVDVFCGKVWAACISQCRL